MSEKPNLFELFRVQSKFGEAKVTENDGITIIPSHFIHELFGCMGIKLYLCTQYIAHKTEKSRITHNI